MQLTDVYWLFPEGCGIQPDFFRRESLEVEKRWVKAVKWLQQYHDNKLPDMPLKKALHLYYNGFVSRAEPLFNKSNNLFYFLIWAEMKFWQKQLRIAYEKCGDKKCMEHIITKDPEIAKWEEQIKCLSCQEYDHKMLKSLLKDIYGFQMEDIKEKRQGINYMCIINETIPNFTCSCEDTIFFVS